MTPEWGRGAALACLLLGCAAAPRWSARSPAGDHEARLEEGPDGARVILDGEARGPFVAVALDALVWTETGAAVPVQTPAGWHVLRAGSLGPAHRAVGELHAEGGALRYAALDGDGWRLFDGDRVGPPHAGVIAGSVVRSHGHLAYLARDRDGARAVIDQAPQRAHRHVDRLGFAGKRGLVVYVGYDDDGARVIAGSRASAPYDAVHELARAPLAARWAAIVERAGALWLLRDGDEAPLPRGARGLALSDDGARVGWIVPGEPERIVVDGRPVHAAAELAHLGFVPITGAPLFVARGARGWRVVHNGRPGPRFDAVEPPVTSRGGRWAYLGHRAVGDAVVVDGEAVVRAEWASAPVLEGPGWACLARRGAQRFVHWSGARSRGRFAVPRPFVDTLVLDPGGAHVAVAVADEGRRELRVYVDGRDAGPLAAEALIARAGDGAEGARAVVGAVMARALDARGEARDGGDAR